MSKLGGGPGSVTLDTGGSILDVKIHAPTGPWLVTTALITDVASSPIPVPLTARVAIAVRNLSATEYVYIGPSNSVVASVAVGTTSGWRIDPSNDQNIDLDDSTQFYMICEAGKSALVQIIEVAST